MRFGLTLSDEVPNEPYAILGSSELCIREWCKGKTPPCMVGTFDAWDSDPFPDCQTWKAIQNFPSMAKMAADLLCERIAGNPVKPGLRLVPISEIVKVQ